MWITGTQLLQDKRHPQPFSFVPVLIFNYSFVDKEWYCNITLKGETGDLGVLDIVQDIFISGHTRRELTIYTKRTLLEKSESGWLSFEWVNYPWCLWQILEGYPGAEQRLLYCHWWLRSQILIHAAASSFPGTVVRKLEWKTSSLVTGKREVWCNLYFYFENESKICLRSINKIFLRSIVKLLHREDCLNCQTSSPNCSATCEPQKWGAQIRHSKTLWGTITESVHIHEFFPI